MRVVLLARAVSPLHGHGGLERHVAALDKYLRREGCDVTLWTTPAETTREHTRFVPYRLLPWPRSPGFVVLDRDTNYLAWSLRAGRRALAETRTDVVQADGGAGFGYALLAKRGAPPLILHPHGMEEFKAPAVKRALYLPLRTATRFAARRAARVIAPDASMRGEVNRHLHVDEERIALLPNAIDLEDVDREPPRVDLERFGIPPRAKVLLSVGRLESNKGFPLLVRALARVPLSDEALWVLAGDGPERSRVESDVDRAGLRGRARCLGRVSDDVIHALYERAALFVHPTLYEGSSMVTLEAMAHRKPVVATRVGGIPDKVASGETGLLVPPGDVEALAAAIEEALSDADRLLLWGRRGREVVEERFSWSRRVREVLALYEDVLRTRAAV